MQKLLCIIIIFMMTVIGFSCGTRKSVKTEQKDMHTESVDSTHIITSRRDTFEWSKMENSYTGIRITITDLSPPDSFGRQHSTKKTEITIDNKKESNENASGGTHLIQEGAEVNKNKLDDHSTVETKKDTDTRFLPGWVWWALLVAGVIVALLAWLVGKRK